VIRLEPAMIEAQDQQPPRHLSLAYVRDPVAFRAEDLSAIELCFDYREPSSAWCGLGTVGRGAVERVLLFAADGPARVFTLTKFSDASYELAGQKGRLLRRDQSLPRLMSGFVEPVHLQ
jgi:hypothetical protein